MPTLPTILVLNGILMMPMLLPTPLRLLISDLRDMGFRVVEDTHFMMSYTDEEPVVIIGHSRGGGTALQYAAKLKREAKFQPLVITFDAVPPYRCPTHCINFQTREYKSIPVPGAQNILVDLPSIPIATHTAMPLSPDVRAQIKRMVAPYAKPMS
jgi:pimeloyl-ACP methyl ester carboxylesterase